MPPLWIVLGLIGYFALKQDNPPAAAPAPAEVPQAADPPLDPHMPADVHRAVWGAYKRCLDPGYLRAFAAELDKSGFRIGALFLTSRANQLQPPPQAAPVQQAAPAPAAAPAVQVPTQEQALAKAIAALSPEQRAEYIRQMGAATAAPPAAAPVVEAAKPRAKRAPKALAPRMVNGAGAAKASEPAPVAVGEKLEG